MRVRDSIALTLPSFFLRLVLGVTFLWAGTGKLLGTMQVSGEDAARLANLGVHLEPVKLADEPSSEPESQEPISPLPSDEQPEEPAGDLPLDDQLEEQAKEIIEQLKESADDVIEDTQDQVQNALPTDPPAELPIEQNILGFSNSVPYTLTRVQNTASDRTASDFPEPVQCQRVYSIALMISKAADPGLNADSQPITPIMPTKFAGAPWPKILAWSAAIASSTSSGFSFF